MVSKSDQDASTFSNNSFASLAKAIAFRSIAIHALKHHDRIGGTVFCYYSLFHLVITLMYSCPDKIERTLLGKLRNARGKGETDPSKMISHDAALHFAKSCIPDGLDHRLHLALDKGKTLREFVNYGPRVTIKDGTPYFGPCSYQPSDCENLITGTRDIFREALAWAYKHGPLKGAIVQLAPEACLQFFEKPDLFYLAWCSKECVEDSLAFIADLREVVPYGEK